MLRRKKKESRTDHDYSNPEQNGKGEKKILNILCPECDLIPRERTRNSPQPTEYFPQSAKYFLHPTRYFAKYFFRQLNASKNQ